VQDASGKAIAGVNVCSQHCNPLQPQTPDASHGACGAGAGCLPSGTTSGISDCVGGYGSGTQDAACTNASQCAVGYFCGYQPGKCVKYCRPGIASDCLATYSCVSFSPKAYDGAQEIGVCNK
jgi:hypothetical protein